MGNPRIGLVARHLHATAGLGTHERNMLRELGDFSNRYDFMVYTDSEPPTRVSGLDYRILPLGTRGGLRLRQLMWDQRTVPAAAKHDNLQIIHWLHPSGSLRAAAPKTIIMVCDANPWKAGYRRDLKMRLYSEIDRMAARRADHINTISEYSLHDIAKTIKVPEDRFTITPLAGPPRVTTQPPKPRVSQPYILFLGGSEVRKNPSRVIEGFVAADIPPDITLVIAGRIQQSPIDEDIGNLIASLPDEQRRRIATPGMVSDSELARLYAHALFFAYPSLSEGFGFPPLEAMAYGTPVLTSTATSLPEVAGDGALLVDPLDTVALTQAIERLSTDSALRTELVERGFVQAGRFSWLQTIEKTVAVYDRVLAE